ncbi:MAG: BREX system ATP-binding domain-containing protein [Candidatus Bathyarchaeia archaeon]
MLKSRVLTEPVLVGREHELEELQSALNSAMNGKGATVFVSGEAGSGKTRLIATLLDKARKQGAITLTGWCLSNAAVPYFPFFEAFNAYFSGGQREEKDGNRAQLSESQTGLNEMKTSQRSEDIDIISWLMGPTQAGQFGKSRAISPQVWKDQTFAAVTRTLTAISTEKPVILFIDDVHWADSASLALIHYIARAINSEKVLLLATFRSEQITADAEGRPHPLVETLRLMKREDLFKEIKIANLNQKVVSELAENMLGGDLQVELAEKLAKESQGNPLFIVESLRMLHECGSLIHEHDKWRLSQGEIGIPDKIRDIILQRLSSLTRNRRKVLDAASVIGERFDAELVASVLGQEPAEVIETLDMIWQTTSLVCCKGELYWFDHATSRDAVYGEISSAQRRVYHAKIAEKLEDKGKDGKLQFSDLAYQYAQAGNKLKAVEYSLAAAKDELERWSNSLAIKHFEYVLQNIQKENAEKQRTALEGLGDAYAANYMYGEAIKTYDELAASETGVVRLRALRKAMDAAFLKGEEPDLLLEYLRKAEEMALDDRLEMARVINTRAKSWGFAGHGDLEMDQADYDMALRIFEEENSIADVANALRGSGLLCARFEDSREKGLGELLRSVAIFNELGDARKEIEASLVTGFAFLLFSGLFPEARQEYAKVLRIGEKLDVFAELAQACGRLANFDDEDREALEAHVSQALKGLEYHKKTDVNWLQGFLYAILTRLYSKLGDLRHADEYFNKMTKLSPEILSHYNNEFAVAISKSVYFAAKSKWEESRQCFEEVLMYCDTAYAYPGQEVSGKINYAWALEKQGKIEEAKVQRDRVQKVLEQVEERFRHANLQLSVMMPMKVQVGEEFEMRLDLVNIARGAAKKVRVKGAIPSGFTAVSLPSYCYMQSGNLEIKERSVGPFQVETIKLKLKVVKPGSYSLNPQLLYGDDLGQEKTFQLSQITINVETVKPTYEALLGRVSTGTMELDRLLLGGIPESYAVALAASSCDERQLLVKHFLETGVEKGEKTLYIACEDSIAQDLAKQFQTNFYLMFCLQADLTIQSLPNVFTLKGVDNLTDIDIALTKFFRTLDTSQIAPKRACIGLLSDVLLQHHTVVTRKWLSRLLANLKSKGFTTLAVIDPLMHPSEEVQAILGLFEGEITITQKESNKGLKKVLKILKLYNQEYLEDELTLTREGLHSKY